MTGVQSGAQVFPPISIRNILRENWDYTNTSLSEEPFIHTGWYGDVIEGPQVTVTNPTETKQIVAVDGKSGDPVTQASGDVTVGCWGGELTEDSISEQLAHEFRVEVERITHGYTDGIVATDGSRPFERIGDTGANWQIDPDRSPPVCRYDVFVGYEMRRR